MCRNNGAPRASTKPGVISLVADVDIRVIATRTGELLRHLTLNPNRDYQPQNQSQKTPSAQVRTLHMSRDIKILSGRRDLNPRPSGYELLGACQAVSARAGKCL